MNRRDFLGAVAALPAATVAMMAVTVPSLPIVLTDAQLREMPFSQLMRFHRTHTLVKFDVSPMRYYFEKV